MNNQPSVFVSSTCYDLAQVRQDLRLFIETLGMIPAMSEFNTFPVDPNLDAVANCLAAVKERADIFILVVGGRYGSQTEGGKSVTNLEYLEAKARGIPRYIFVKRDILTALPIWEKNQSGDFSGIVDSAKLFEFVRSLRDPRENWVFPFESAQEIIETLRRQLAYLFKDALDIRRKMVGTNLSVEMEGMSGVALVLAVQKPFAWEIRLFTQVLADEMKLASSARRDLDYGVVLEPGARLSDLRSVLDWIQTKMGEIITFVGSADKLVNVAAPKAFGPAGSPGDVDEIIYVARRLALVYRRLLIWTMDFRLTQVDDEFAGVLDIVSRASRNVITELETFSKTIQERVKDAISGHERTQEPQSLELTLMLTCPDMTDLDAEFRRIAERHGISY